MKRRMYFGAFTLVELLTVIGIIAVLITLLFPAFSKATDIVHTSMTRKTFKELGAGLDAFHNDWKVYPPSRPCAAAYPFDTVNQRDPASGEKPTGPSNLVYYLIGPAATGWGINGGGYTPVLAPRSDPQANPAATTTGTLPTRSYGPYFQTTPDRYAFDPGTTSGSLVLAGLYDAFNPPGRILYWRYEPSGCYVQAATSYNKTYITTFSDTIGGLQGPKTTTIFFNYNVQDCNPVDSAGHQSLPGNSSGNPPSGRGDDGSVVAGGVSTQNGGLRNYFDQARFDEITIVNRDQAMAALGAMLPRYIRMDYILVSPGADGRYGYVRTGTATADYGFKYATSKTGDVNGPPDDGTPDDITNF